MPQAKIGVIGGSGLYEMEGLTDIEEVQVATPFGDPSDVITIGRLEEVPIAFLPRHGRGHRLLPTEVPSQANIYALKTLDVEWVISISAVGSLKEEIEPLHLVIPDQIIDRTKSRCNTFFGNGLVAHVGFADPFCNVLSDILYQSAQEAGARVHKGGTYVAMEGPLFSTRAESNLYRSWGASIIGMTALPEAKLAREAEMCYVSVAFVTDYDCWHPTDASVSAEMIIRNLVKGAETARSVVRRIVRDLPRSRSCRCGSALSDAIVTPAHLVPQETKKKLESIAGRYLFEASQ